MPGRRQWMPAGSVCTFTGKVAMAIAVPTGASIAAPDSVGVDDLPGLSWVRPDVTCRAGFLGLKHPSSGSWQAGTPQGSGASGTNRREAKPYGALFRLLTRVARGLEPTNNTWQGNGETEVGQVSGK